MENDAYKSIKIFVDPTSRVYYASFYLQGLYDLLGKSNVRFSNKYFADLERETEFSFEHYFAFITEFADGTQKKIVVDFCDPPDINRIAYDWCDVYAKINFDPNKTPIGMRDKILLIPPSFGIQIWGAFETYAIMATNLAKCRFRPIVSLKRFLQDYRLQLKRTRLQCYTSTSETANGYVFMIATLWNDSETVNRFRKKFIDAVLLTCEFEGGFFSRSIPREYEAWKRYVFSAPYSISQYIKKTKRSSFAFNTPAVHGCHGWKLAEYLAMGKAIVSTRLTNNIFPELRHEEHLHFIDSIDDIELAVRRLHNDANYREALENGAAHCYATAMQPHIVVARILDRAMDSE